MFFFEAMNIMFLLSNVLVQPLTFCADIPSVATLASSCSAVNSSLYIVRKIENAVDQ